MALNLRQSTYVNLSHLNSVATKEESPCLGQNKVSKLCTYLRFPLWEFSRGTGGMAQLVKHVPSKYEDHIKMPG